MSTTIQDNDNNEQKRKKSRGKLDFGFTTSNCNSEASKLRAARLRTEYLNKAAAIMANSNNNLLTPNSAPAEIHHLGGGGISPTSRYGRHFAVVSGKSGNENNALHPSTSTPLVIAFVGLPGRGKTYMSKKLSRYLNWINVDTKVFNLGDYRRKLDTYNNHNLFNPDNPEGLKLRTKACEDGLRDATDWLEKDGGEVAVIDATNATVERRKLIYNKVVNEKGFKLFFVESICDDVKIIESNINEVRSSPDYVGFNEGQIMEDFKKRIAHYEHAYQAIDEKAEPELSFMKIINAGEEVVVYKADGHIQSRIVYYLMNTNITPRTIYLTRHGESQYNVLQKLGGDPDLSPNGKEYAFKLAEYINSLNIENLSVWTSYLKRTIQTAEYIKGNHERWKTLNEIDVGICDGMTYEEVQREYPKEFQARDEDKYRYRYPQGESYQDLVARLEPVIMELEKRGDILVIAHQAVLRCILAYFVETDPEELPYLKIPMHTIISLRPRAYGCKIDTHKIDVDCVDTHRPKPKVSGTLTEEKLVTTTTTE